MTETKATAKNTDSTTADKTATKADHTTAPTGGQPASDAPEFKEAQQVSTTPRDEKAEVTPAKAESNAKKNARAEDKFEKEEKDVPRTEESEHFYATVEVAASGVTVLNVSQRGHVGPPPLTVAYERADELVKLLGKIK